MEHVCVVPNSGGANLGVTCKLILHLLVPASYMSAALCPGCSVWLDYSVFQFIKFCFQLYYFSVCGNIF